MKSFECKSEVKIQFVDEVSKNHEKDIEVLEVKIQSHNIHDQDQSLQMIFMSEKKKERMLPPFSFEFQE